MLVYLHVYFNTPQHQFWAVQVPDWRWAYMAALLLVASCILHRDKLSSAKLASLWPFRFLIAMLIYMFVLAPFTLYPDVSVSKAYEFFRYVAIFGLTVKIIRDHRQFRIFFAAWLVECFLLSRLAFHYFGGERLEYGIADAISANLAAAFMVMSLPLCLSFWMGEDWKKKLFFAGIAAFLLNAFMMYRSRGAFVGLAASGMVLAYSIGSFQGYRKKLFVAAVGGLAALVVLIDPLFIERLREISFDQLSEASTGRIDIWTYGIEMFKDFPFGAGGDAFVLLSPAYLPEYLLEQTSGTRASHNTFLQVLVEQGIPGTVFYACFFLSTFRQLKKHRRRILGGAKDSEDRILGADSRTLIDNVALQCALVGILASAFFMDRFYFLGIYWFSALAVALANLEPVQRDIEATNEGREPAETMKVATNP